MASYRPDYEVGTVTVALNGTVVTGVGTLWLAGGFKQGDWFSSKGYPPTRIVTVDSNTQITIEPWRGAALATGSPYYIRYQADGSSYAAALGQVRAMLQQGNIIPFNALVGAAGKIPYFIDADEMGLLDAPTNGLGDVKGPSVAIDGNAVVADGTTGKLIRQAGGKPVIVALTRTALAALDVTKEPVVYFDGSEWELVTLVSVSQLVTADTAKGIYVQSTQNTAWVWKRRHTGEWKFSWFGILSTNTAAANTTGFNAMMSLAIKQDTWIDVPNVVCDFTGVLTVTTAFQLTFTGVAKASTMRWTSAAGGLEITYSNTRKAPAIWGVEFVTQGTNGGTALRIVAPNSSSVTCDGPLVIDVSTRGDNLVTQNWTIGIECQNCWYPNIIRASIKGRENATVPFDQAVGISGVDCQGMIIRDPVIFHVQKGYYGTGSLHGEGLQISGGEIVGVGYGIHHNIGVFKPCIGIHDIHINAAIRGIALVNTGQCKIHNVHIYKTNNSTQAFQHIDFNNCKNNQISDIYLSAAGVPSGSGGCDGIGLIGGATNNIFTNVHASDWAETGSLFIGAGTTVTDNKITGTKIDAATAPNLSVLGIPAPIGNNYWESITPKSSIILPSGNATPSVKNDLYGLWEYTGSAVTVTNFLDGYNGQEITVFSNTGSAVLTFSHNANLILRSGATYLLPAGGFIKFIFRGVWREMFRGL